ncbi:MAG: alpha-galactosidase [Culicoidibacterales bacterium]
MAIKIDLQKQVFHLQTREASYVCGIVEGEYLAHFYYGKRIQSYNGSNAIAYVDRGFAPNPPGKPRTFSLDTLPQEYPCYGNGDFRQPAYQIEFADGTRVSDLKYETYNHNIGKSELAGLPATYPLESDTCETLTISLYDKIAKVRVILTYTVFEEKNMMTRHVRIINESTENLHLLRCLSMNIDFRDSDFELLTLYGAHNNEKNVERRQVNHQIQKIESSRGTSSPHQAPYFALLRKETTETQGDVYAFNFVYSGNFVAQVQQDHYDSVRVQMGINDFDFKWQLKPGQDFQTPEVVMSYTSQGLGASSRDFHQFYRHNLCRGHFKEKSRPILINNWEATYFDFEEKKLLEIAKKAQAVGIELFVLDDGWFGKRNDDTTSLGDWVVNEEKLPNGLNNLATSITGLGMEFGIWFEPEMISQVSDLYKQHPDWCLRIENREPTIGRGQLVLDLGNPEVINYLFNAITKILESAPITYVKWDMNRHLTDLGSAILPTIQQSEVVHRYVLGLYNLMERLTTKFSTVLFESCSSGGGRYDAGMLYYMPQTWTSDNTDAICRLSIQYGTSLVYPPVTMGCHVSTTPNHQVGRETPLQTRGVVAMAGNFGYELDVTKLEPTELAEIEQQIQHYKKYRDIFQFGDLYRLLAPTQANDAAWSMVSRDKEIAIVTYVKLLSLPAAPIKILKLQGLEETDIYEHTETGECFSGDELMNAGITVPRVKVDFHSQQWIFKKKQ